MQIVMKDTWLDRFKSKDIWEWEEILNTIQAMKDEIDLLNDDLKI